LVANKPILVSWCVPSSEIDANSAALLFMSVSASSRLFNPLLVAIIIILLRD
jgi:hypothetical protein